MGEDGQMTDYISREAVLHYICYEAYTAGMDLGFFMHNLEVQEDIKKIPAADVAPVVHARWLKNDNETWSCGRCQSWIPNEQHYYARFCLYCGAKMDGGERDAVD